MHDRTIRQGDYGKLYCSQCATDRLELFIPHTLACVNSVYISTVVHYVVVALAVVASMFVLYWLVRLVIALINRRYLHSRQMVWLELTPPARLAKTPESTAQLFSVVHGLRSARSFKERLLNRAPVMSFEIVSSKKEGIRYLIQVEARSASALDKIIAAYIPEAKT